MYFLVENNVSISILIEDYWLADRKVVIPDDVTIGINNEEICNVCVGLQGCVQHYRSDSKDKGNGMLSPELVHFRLPNVLVAIVHSFVGRD